MYDCLTVIVTVYAFFVESSRIVTCAGIEPSFVAAQIACFKISKKPACRYSLMPPPVLIILRGSSLLQDASLFCIAFGRFSLKGAVVVVFFNEFLVPCLCKSESSLPRLESLLVRMPVLEVLRRAMLLMDLRNSSRSNVENR